MKKQFRFGVAGVLSMSAFSLVTTTAAPTGAHGALILEPIVEGGYGTSSSPLLTNKNVVTYGGGIRFGAIKDDLFTVAEGHFNLGQVGSANAGTMTYFGITGGMNFPTIPVRLTLSYYFSSAYSDSLLSLGGGAFGLGIGYFLGNTTVLNLIYTKHIYDTVTTSLPAGLSLPTSLDSLSFNSVALSISIPLEMELPKEPWRRKQPARFTHSPTSDEALDLPSAPLPESVPEPLPELPPELPPEPLSELLPPSSDELPLEPQSAAPEFVPPPEESSAAFPEPMPPELPPAESELPPPPQG